MWSKMQTNAYCKLVCRPWLGASSSLTWSLRPPYVTAWWPYFLHAPTLCMLQVRELKAELQEKEGIESKQIRLVYGGKKMWVVVAVVALWLLSLALIRQLSTPQSAAGTTTTLFPPTRSRRGPLSTWFWPFVAAFESETVQGGRELAWMQRLPTAGARHSCRCNKINRSSTSQTVQLYWSRNHALS